MIDDIWIAVMNYFQACLQLPNWLIVLSAEPSGCVIVTSAHARNSSWGPHPTASVPFLHRPAKNEYNKKCKTKIGYKNPH